MQIASIYLLRIQKPLGIIVIGGGFWLKLFYGCSYANSQAPVLRLCWLTVSAALFHWGMYDRRESPPSIVVTIWQFRQVRSPGYNHKASIHRHTWEAISFALWVCLGLWLLISHQSTHMNAPGKLGSDSACACVRTQAHVLSAPTLPGSMYRNRQCSDTLLLILSVYPFDAFS